MSQLDIARGDGQAWNRLNAAEQAAMKAAGYIRGWLAGEIMAVQGDPPSSMYVILSGCVKIVATNDRGENAPIAARGAGDIIGELAPISDRPRAAAVEAITDVRALVIPRDRARGVLRRHPQIAEELLRTTAMRLAQSDRLRLEAGGPDFAHRLAAVLVELALQCSPDATEDARIDLPFRQDELAAFARVSRSTLIRGLEELRALHLVESTRGHTTLPRLGALLNLATRRSDAQ